MSDFVWDSGIGMQAHGVTPINLNVSYGYE